MIAALHKNLTWGDGSNDEAMRGFIETSIQQAARDWQRAASPRANREKAARRIALDFLARNLGLWKNETNHWVLHDSLAEICEAIFLETLADEQHHFNQEEITERLERLERYQEGVHLLAAALGEIEVSRQHAMAEVAARDEAGVIRWLTVMEQEYHRAKEIIALLPTRKSGPFTE